MKTASSRHDAVERCVNGSGDYGVMDQTEFTTDVLFPDGPTLKPLFESRLNRATTCFTAGDVLTFLGRKLHGKLLGEILTDFKRRVQGARVKHCVAGNWVKMWSMRIVSSAQIHKK